MDKAFFLKAEVPERSTTFRQLRVIGQQHPAFASRDMFIWIKAKRADLSKATTWFAIVGLADDLRRVLD